MTYPNHLRALRRMAPVAAAIMIAGAVASSMPSDSASAQRRPAAPPPPAAGCGSPGAIGLSRTVEIDTSSGPRYGHQQYKDIDFLQDGEIVLTFDDGPLRPYTVPVLKALEAHCTKATFFVVGRMAIADPELVRDTARRGHTIGTHTFSHADARKIGPGRARAEAELGFSAVSRALGRPVAPFFRFPYLSAPESTTNYVRSRGIGVFSIDADAYDYRTKDPAAVHRTIVNQLMDKRKGILLFHDIQPATAGAMLGLLSDLKSRGFRVVHIVPKGQSQTLAEFDAMADKEMKRRGSANPLANRSIVLGAEPPGKPSVTPGAEVLPWGTVAVKPPPLPPLSVPTPPDQAAPQPRPRRAPVEDDDWATRLFR
ncbi:MAG: polysaccharide deacetylase family protein [Hyphomicrobiaceae bacterium]|nr:polysaccharide deacetylase family protein [Hyphomicrobiaceae bacterium]